MSFLKDLLVLRVDISTCRQGAVCEPRPVTAKKMHSCKVAVQYASACTGGACHKGSASAQEGRALTGGTHTFCTAVGDVHSCCRAGQNAL